ncbi:MAG TPA: glycosyltransferase family 2 protein [Pirellulaceae bacterium]|mgnify:CR=1 FL=1|nr:glycosyltransferase family 2 protein [Pirellulaceae bacterium]
MKLPLTVIIPCKNEERNIRPCMESIIQLADEVLVADSGSTDRTMEIASEFPKTRIIQREYVTAGDFKNWAIPQAKHEWVLVVDADERVPLELTREIEFELSRGPSADGYFIYRDNHFMGHRMRFGDARTDHVMRLFHRDRCYYDGPSDHGEVVVNTGRIGYLKNKLVHYSVWSYDDVFRKYQRYTTLQAQEWHAVGRNTSYFKLLLRPVFRFIREYLLQGGILDGKVGLQQAWLAAFYTFLKQARLWELNHGLPQPDPEAARRGHASAETKRAA